ASPAERARITSAPSSPARLEKILTSLLHRSRRKSSEATEKPMRIVCPADLCSVQAVATRTRQLRSIALATTPTVPDCFIVWPPDVWRLEIRRQASGKPG